MTFIIEKPKTKNELLDDPKFQHYSTIGDSLQFLKRRNTLLKVGLYIGRFNSLTAKDAVFLSLAKTKCNILVVGLQSDYSVRVNNEKSLFEASAKERSFLVGSLPFVDWVYVYDEEHPELSVSTINPDYIFCGLYLDDNEIIKGFDDKKVLIEHPFDLVEIPKKKIPLKYFDLPVE